MCAHELKKKEVWMERRMYRSSFILKEKQLSAKKKKKQLSPGNTRDLRTIAQWLDLNYRIIIYNLAIWGTEGR